jgi:hypothetical protein
MLIAQPLEGQSDAQAPFLLGPTLPTEMLQILQTPELATLNYVKNEVDKRTVQGLLAWNEVPVEERVFSKYLNLEIVI